MNLDDIRKTYVVYEDEQNEDVLEGEGSKIDQMDDPNFDMEYVAKVLSYKTQLQHSQTVGIISYRDPNKIRYFYLNLI